MNFEDLEWETFEYMAKKLNFYILRAKFVVLVHLSLKKSFTDTDFHPSVSGLYHLQSYPKSGYSSL